MRFKNGRIACGTFVKKAKNVPSGSTKGAPPVPGEFENIRLLTSTNVMQLEKRELVVTLKTPNVNDIWVGGGVEFPSAEGGCDMFQLDEIES